MKRDPEIVIVGAGPAGLGAAATLDALSRHDYLLLDREEAPGGIARLCPHRTFGRLETGQEYTSRLASRLDPSRLHTRSTVLAIAPDLALSVSTPDGMAELRPRRVLVATGIREAPRAARLVTGDRPVTVFTTGALQRMIVAGRKLPFRAPVIVGTELVSYSAVLMLRERGIRPIAMIERGSRIMARRPADLIARWVFGVPAILNTAIASINSHADDPGRLASISLVTDGGETRQIDCDAVIFTGQFVPEAALVEELGSGLLCGGSRGPDIDQSWQTAHAGVYAAGNVLRPVETARWSCREGMAAARAIVDDLDDALPHPRRRIRIAVDDPVRFVTPSMLTVPGPLPGPLHMVIRMARAARGRLTLTADGRVAWRSPRMLALPERRIRVTRALPDLGDVEDLKIGFEPE